MTYTIDNTSYKTKKEITSEAQQLFGEWKPNRSPLDGKSRSFFLSLLKHHDEWKRKTKGADDDQIILQPENVRAHEGKHSYGLRLYFGSNKFPGEGISWRHAIKCLDKD